MYFDQQKKLRFISLAICLALGFDAIASTGKTRLSDEEIRALGEDPKGGEFYRLNLDPKSANADQLTPQGGSATFITSVAASEFRPRGDAEDFNVPNHAALLCVVGSLNSVAEAQIQFTHGAKLQFLRIYGADSSAQNLNVALMERCQPISSAGNVTTTVLATSTTSGTPERFTQSQGFPAGTTVDNNLCTYSLRVQLGDSINACGANLFLDKARVQWIE